MRKLRITIENKSYDVTVEDLTDAADSYRPAPVPLRSAGAAPPTAAPAPAAGAAPTPGPQQPRQAGAVTSPMAGAIKGVLVKPGDSVTKGQSLVVLEAMKMENQITAPTDGTVKSVDVKEGDAVQEGHVLLVLE